MRSATWFIARAPPCCCVTPACAAGTTTPDRGPRTCDTTALNFVIQDGPRVAIPFDRSFTAPYEEPQKVSPLISRVLAENPGPFTFRGTGVYIVGDRDVAVIDPGPDTPSHVAALRRALEG